MRRLPAQPALEPRVRYLSQARANFQSRRTVFTLTSRIAATSACVAYACGAAACLVGGSTSCVHSDVFAFGVVALEMVTGSPNALVPPRSVAPTLSASWDNALVACFNHDPGKRPASPAEVVALLRHRKRSWNRSTAMAAAGVTFAVAGLAAWSLLGGRASFRVKL